jgi:hypothetical protein
MVREQGDAESPRRLEGWHVVGYGLLWPLWHILPNGRARLGGGGGRTVPR